MTLFWTRQMVVGPLAERPAANDPRLNATNDNEALYLSTDDGALTRSDGANWWPVEIGSGGSLPGVSGDGQTPGGLNVAGAINAGDQTVGTPMSWSGTLEIDTPSNINQPTLYLRQLVGVTGIHGNKSTLYVQRGNSDGTSITRPVVTVENDDVASVADALYYFSPDGLHDVQINVYGGLGLFNHAAPVAPSSITGALSAVTDAATKALLTSIIAALTADGGATDGTT